MSEPRRTKARPFAYNIGAPFTGTDQIGSLAVGTPTVGFDNTGLTWWEGPDESLGYVITTPDGTNTQPTPVPGVDASVSFYRTATLSESELVGLAEFISKKNNSPQTFTDAIDAKSWLYGSNFWTSYLPYFLEASYNDSSSGTMTFPDHANLVGDTDPNNVGVRGGSTATQMYINSIDAAGVTDQNLAEMQGNRGTLTLKQGSNSVTYAFAADAFFIAGSEIIYDNVYGDSGVGSISVLNPASGNFNTTDAMSVSYRITNPNHTFTINSSMLNGLASIGNSDYGLADGTSGFTISQQINNLWYGVYGNLNDTTRINEVFNAVGAIENYNGYIMMAEWGPGSTFPSSLAKVSFNGSQFNITSVDSRDNDFTVQGNNAGSNLVGTFNFPVTLTFVDPLISKVDWC